jgi:uncharacterized membrane protein
MSRNRSMKISQHPVSESRDADQIGLERLVFFSDAVFAIAITLLTLEIRLPEEPPIVTDADLFARLTGMWHEYLAFLISFMVIGTFWMAHHRKFRLIKRYDSRLTSLNLLFLLVVAFMPFPSHVISQYSQRTATIFYALVIALAGLILTTVWYYASSHNRLTDPSLSAEQRRRQLIAPLVTTAIFIASIGVAFWNADLARLSWILLLPASMYANQKQIAP